MYGVQRMMKQELLITLSPNKAARLCRLEISNSAFFWKSPPRSTRHEVTAHGTFSLHAYKAVIPSPSSKLPSWRHFGGGQLWMPCGSAQVVSYRWYWWLMSKIVCECYLLTSFRNGTKNVRLPRNRWLLPCLGQNYEAVLRRSVSISTRDWRPCR
jgi:hypothetical protein